jgi:plastocyanin
MIWRSLICFSLAFSWCFGATVRGQITLTNISRHHAKHADASGVVVWLESAPGEEPLPQAAPIRAQMLQKNKAFLPHVLAVTVGSVIDFPNDDPIFHNAFSNYNGQIFDIGLYPPGSSRSVKFRRAGVVRVFCNIHSFMSAVIVVLPSPFYAESHEDGSFEISNVPRGTYRMEFYYEKATEQTLDRLTRTVTVTVTDATEDVGSIAISESGYLPIPHLNKFGKQYPETTDLEAYPGARP